MKIFNWPNSVSILRIALLPLFIKFFLSDQRYLAFSILILFIIGDKVDGFLARKLNQESNIGELLDNSADFLFILVILVTFYLTGYLESTMFWMIMTTGAFLASINALIFKKYKSMHSDIIDKSSGVIYFIMSLVVYFPVVFKSIAYLTILTNVGIGIWRMKRFLL